VVQVLSRAVAVEMVQAEHPRVVVSVVLHFQLPELPRFTVRAVAVEDTTAQADSVVEGLQIAEQAMAVASHLQLPVALVLPTQVAEVEAVEREMLQVAWVDLA
jgi:hypothetical protein